MVTQSELVYGSTGEIGKDGVLTPELVMTLDAIQSQAVRSLRINLDNIQPDDEKPLVAMATGIGKGKIIHDFLEGEIRRKPDTKMLVIAGTKVELVRQTHNAIAEYQTLSVNPLGGMVLESLSTEENDYQEAEEVDESTEEVEDPLADEQSFLIRTGRIGDANANVHITTIQGLLSRLRRNPDYKPEEEYDTVIVDEVHNIGTPKRFEAIKRFKRVAGLTATPRRSSGRMKQPGEYGFKVVEQLPLPEAQDLRLLPPLLGMQINTAEIIDEIPITRSGRIDYRKLETMLKNSPDLHPYIANKIADIIAPADGRRYKTVVAVNYVWEAQLMAQLLKEKGIKVGIAVNQQASKILHTEDIPATDSIERYKLPESNEQSIQVLVSPYVASEGFDAPATEVLVWASPTDSDLRYTQYVGRLARRANGKLFGVVVDCLYQTSQYSWSYNFGMWMKGRVRQLENGLLWLGPEADIDRLKLLPQVEGFQRQSEFKALEDLQKEKYLRVEDSDIVISNDGLQDKFYIGQRKARGLLNGVIREFIDEHPEYVVRKFSYAAYVDVITPEGEVAFRELMKDQGVRERSKDLKPIQEGEFGLSPDSLTTRFEGSHERVNRALEEVLRELGEEHPEWIIPERMSGSGIIRAIAAEGDADFVIKMGGKGIELRDTSIERLVKDLQEGDTIINQKSVRGFFVGKGERVFKTAQDVMQRLAIENPGYVESRKGGRKVVTQAGWNRFVQLMNEADIKSR